MKSGLKIAACLCAVLSGGALLIFGISYLNRPQRIAPVSARIALMAGADNPESVKINAVSKPDSVLGREYVSDEEKINISSLMMRVTEKVMKETGNLESFDSVSTELSDLMTRHMSTAAVMRSMMNSSLVKNRNAKLTGWKVKIDYEAVSVNGNPYRSEFWAFTDKTGKHVVKSFEIPIVEDEMTRK